MVFLGAAPEGGDYRTCCALHSNRMVLNEDVMARGISMLRRRVERDANPEDGLGDAEILGERGGVGRHVGDPGDVALAGAVFLVGEGVEQQADERLPRATCW